MAHAKTLRLLSAGLVASCTLAGSLDAQAVSPMTSAEARIARQQIACHGVASVPMTFDAEQSLPLKLVANLPCGQEVGVLSDLEGYTVRVATPQGLAGYVARVYLAPAPKPAPSAPRLISTLRLSSNSVLHESSLSFKHRQETTP